MSDNEQIANRIREFAGQLDAAWDEDNNFQLNGDLVDLVEVALREYACELTESPVLPDDVAKVIHSLRCKELNYAADMLERQQQRIAELENPVGVCIAPTCAKSKLEACIAELEAEKEKEADNRQLISMVVANFTDEDKARIRAALAGKPDEQK